MNEVKNTPSRRRFLKSAALGAGAAALGLAGRTTELIARPPRLEKKLGIALVGLGYYSTDVLAPALQETENVRLAGIVTGTPAKAAAWKEKYEIPAANVYNYDNYDRLSENEDIDIVYVVLPNAMHAEYTIRALRAAKHVICEKPMASNARECEAMIAAAEAANRKLSIGYRVQFDPATQQAVRLVEEGEIGAMKMVSAGAGYKESRADHWKLDRELGGGAMMDMGVYSLQGARYITGEEPISVSAQSFTTRPELFTEVDETTLFQLQFPGGAVANLHTSFGVGMNYLHANAEKGWIRLEPFSAYRNVRGESSKGPIEPAGVNQQAAQMDEVAYGIVHDLPMRVPGEEGWRDMRVVDAVYQSIREGGRRITLDPL